MRLRAASPIVAEPLRQARSRSSLHPTTTISRKVPAPDSCHSAFAGNRRSRLSSLLGRRRSTPSLIDRGFLDRNRRWRTSGHAGSSAAEWSDLEIYHARQVLHFRCRSGRVSSSLADRPRPRRGPLVLAGREYAVGPCRNLPSCCRGSVFPEASIVIGSNVKIWRSMG